MQTDSALTDIPPASAWDGFRASPASDQLSSAAKYSAISIALPDPCGITRVADGQYIEVNPAFCAMFGLTREQAVGRTSLELGVWANPEQRERLVLALERDGRVDQLSLRARAQGQDIPGLMSAAPVEIEGEACMVFVFHDISGERAARDRLAAAHALLSQAGHMAGLGAWESDARGVLQQWSDACCEVHGVPHGTPPPVDYIETFIAPHCREIMREAVRACLHHGEPWLLDLEVLRADDRTTRWMRAHGEAVREGGYTLAMRGVMQDIDAAYKAEQALREREAVLSLTLEAASLALWDSDLVAGTVTGDAAWHALINMPVQADCPETWRTCLAAVDHDAVYADLMRHAREPAKPFDVVTTVPGANEGKRWVRNLGKIVSWDAQRKPTRMLGVCIDVTDQRQHEMALQRLAHYDALTHLPNRVLMAEQLAEAMARARSSGKLLGVAYLDLDGFKPVNDRFGHAAGDQLLQSTAQRLSSALRPEDCVARLGGDEFAILLPDLETPHDAQRALARLMLNIAAPHCIGDQQVSVTASIGYTLFPRDDADADTLLRHADQAMYLAKQLGRNRFHEFDADQERQTREVRVQLQQLRHALENGQFELYLQPKVDMRLGTVVGAEALARWNHPERGVLGPAAFLPLLEAPELDTGFGAWVVRSGIQLIQRLENAGNPLPISLNIAAPHLQQPGFAAWMGEQLAMCGDAPAGPAALMDLEITETAALFQLETVAQTLRELRALGVTISLDDFGTGYSSLTYLRRLPLNILKIDQSFVRGMMDEAGDLAIVQSVIGLASSFGYQVIAEGVETVDQGHMLLQMGCTLAQGYAIARPMPAADFLAWAARWQAPGSWRTA